MKLADFSLKSLVLALLVFCQSCRSIETQAIEQQPSLTPETPIPSTAVSSPTISSPPDEPPNIETPALTTTTTISVFPTSALPTPAASAWRISDNVLFDNTLVEDCELPCWQGLVIGKSDPHDVQNMFDDIFGFDGSRDFVSEAEAKRYPASNSSSFNGLFKLTQQWIFSEDPLDTFAIRVWIEQATFEMYSVELISDSPRFNPFLTPQAMIQQLGMPSHMFIWLSFSERSDIIRLRILTIYDDRGLVLDGGVESPVKVPSGDNNSQQEVAEICLGGAQWRTSTSTWPRAAYIMPALPADLDELTLYQQDRLGLDAVVSDFNTLTVEDFFDITLEELAALAVSDGDACLHKDLTELYSN